MHRRPLAGIPAAADHAFDLRRKLQQQSIIGLFRLRLNAQRQSILVRRERHRDRRIPHRLASGRESKIAPQMTNQSSTDGLSLSVRYSMVPTFGVGSAVTGVRMMSQSSKNVPKPREVALNTACICARSANVVSRPGFQIRMLTGSTRSAGGRSSPARGEQVADHLGEIADIAGGLRREGCAIVDRRQRVFHMMTEALEKTPYALQSAAMCGVALYSAPLIRERDLEPAGSRATSCV